MVCCKACLDNRLRLAARGAGADVKNSFFFLTRAGGSGILSVGGKEYRRRNHFLLLDRLMLFCRLCGRLLS